MLQKAQQGWNSLSTQDTNKCRLTKHETLYHAVWSYYFELGKTVDKFRWVLPDTHDKTKSDEVLGTWPYLSWIFLESQLIYCDCFQIVVGFIAFPCIHNLSWFFIEGALNFSSGLCHSPQKKNYELSNDAGKKMTSSNGTPCGKPKKSIKQPVSACFFSCL